MRAGLIRCASYDLEQQIESKFVSGRELGSTSSISTGDAHDARRSERLHVPHGQRKQGLLSSLFLDYAIHDTHYFQAYRFKLCVLHLLLYKVLASEVYYFPYLAMNISA